MPANPDSLRYDPYAQIAHWLVVLLLTGSFTLGFIMTELPTSPLRLRLFSWHKWLGVVIFLAVLLRFGWRLRHPAPPLPVTMPVWEREAARISHHFLYLFLFAAPLSG